MTLCCPHEGVCVLGGEQTLTTCLDVNKGIKHKLKIQNRIKNFVQRANTFLVNNHFLTSPGRDQPLKPPPRNIRGNLVANNRISLQFHGEQEVLHCVKLKKIKMVSLICNS